MYSDHLCSHTNLFLSSVDQACSKVFKGDLAIFSAVTCGVA